MPGSYGEVCPLPIRRDKKQVLIGKFPERRIESTPSNRPYGLLAVYIDNSGWRNGTSGNSDTDTSESQYGRGKCGAKSGPSTNADRRERTVSMMWDWPQRIGGINLRGRDSMRVGASDDGVSTGDWLRRDVLQEIARAGEQPAAGASVVKQPEVNSAARAPMQSAADTSPLPEMEQRRIASQMCDSSGQLEQRLCALEARSAGFE